MKVMLAKTAGFCMGVRRAMEIVLAEVNRGNKPLYTFGPLIHNNQVLDILAAKGVNPVENLKGLTEGTIIIRAHGIPPQKRRLIKNSGLKVIDATCPRVAKVQAITRSYTRKGYNAVIVGEKDHAEVKGIMGYATNRVFVIQSVKDVSSLPVLNQVFVVAQTTQNKQNFKEVVNALEKKIPEILIFDTICEATSERQEEARAFKGQVSAVVVVGGYHSGNTRRLVEVAKEVGLPTFHVETEKELDKKRLSKMKVIGVTAGASTPNWMIKNVVKEIEGIRGRRDSSFFIWIKKVFKFLVISNVIVASGAFCLAYASSILSERRPDPVFPLLAFLYIYAMHILNRFLDKGASAFNDPERAVFLNKHRRLLTITGIASILTALAISFKIGIATFIAMSGLSLSGIIYSIPLVPEKLKSSFRYSRIKDIPCSRSLSEALAWMVVITLIPLLKNSSIILPATVTTCLTVLFMAYIRAALFDIFQVQGDLIAGSETLPIRLGEKKTLFILKSVIIACLFIISGAPAAGFTGPFSFLFLIPLATLFLCVIAYERKWLSPCLTFEALIEGNFFLTGILTLVWQALP